MDASILPLLRELDYEESLEILEGFLPLDKEYLVRYHKETQAFYGQDADGNLLFHFVPPRLFPYFIPDTTFVDYVKGVPDLPPEYLILLMQAGQAALAHLEDGEMVNHKVIRKYMVRAKQGKAQHKHLQTRGKSRLGSRIRLQQTGQFFEEINQKLIDWELDRIEQIFVQSSIPLWNKLFESKVPVPFEKRDPRIRKIPLDLPQPNFEVLREVQAFLEKGEVRLSGSLDYLLD